MKPNLRLIVNPNPIPKAPQDPPDGNVAETMAAIERLEAFLKTLDLKKILEPVKAQHGVEAAFLIRWRLDLEQLHATWTGHMDGMRAKMAEEKKNA